MSDYLTEYQAWLERRPISDLLKDREAMAAANQRIRTFVAEHPDFIRDLKARDLADYGPRWQYVPMDIRFGEPDYSAIRDAVYEGDDENAD